MGVVAVKSQAITNRDAVPVVLNNSAITKGPMKKAIGVCAVTSGDDIGSTYAFCSVPSNAVITSVKVSAPDIGTTTIANFGLSQTTANGSAAVDADFFKATQSLKDGALAKVELVNGNVITLANQQKRVWEHLLLTADPSLQYDVVATLTAAADASGSVFLEVEYTE